MLKFLVMMALLCPFNLPASPILATVVVSVQTEGGAPIAYADVTVLETNLKGKTNEQGVVATLTPVGTTLHISAYKSGYKKVSVLKTVRNSLDSVTIRLPRLLKSEDAVDGMHEVE